MADTQKPKSRLGRGLSSLISISAPVAAEANPLPAGTTGNASPDPSPDVPSDTLPTSAGRPTELLLSAVTPNPHQPRRQFDDTRLAELAASLKSNGVIQPIVVRQVDDTYQLIAGERRFRAAKLAGFATIPAIVRSDVDAFAQAQMALVENIQREDLNPLERAQGYRSLLDQLGLTQAELAARLGEDRSTVANFLRLLELSNPVQTLIREGRLSLGHAKLLAGVGDLAEQDRLANLTVQQELSVRNLERLLAGGHVVSAPKATVSSAHVVDLEKTLARQLGMRVQLRAGKKGKGRLVIHYGSLDQFDELLTRIGVRAQA
jgi:ParB family chromosome partitioning protein